MKDALSIIFGVFFVYAGPLILWGSVLSFVLFWVLGIDISFMQGVLIVLAGAGIIYIGIPLLIFISLLPFILIAKLKEVSKNR